MQVRAGGQPGAAHITDHLALGDPPARGKPSGVAREVAVGGRIHPIMLDHNVIAEAAVPAPLNDFTIPQGQDRRPGWGRVIDSQVRTEDFQYRVEPAAVETAGNAGHVFERRAQEFAPHAFSIQVEIIHRAVRVGEADGPEGLTAVVEYRGHDFSQLGRTLGVELFLINQLETVAPLDIIVEVDLPGVDFAQRQRQFRI